MAQWKTTQYLDAAKRKLGIESDYALAKHLGLTQQAISKLRARGDVMSNTTAAKVAAIIGWEIALPSTPAPTSARDATEIHIVRRLRHAARALLAFLIGLAGVAL